MLPAAVVAAHHAATLEIKRRLEAGTLDAALAPMAAIESVGIGHSMGALLTLCQQAAHGTHAALVILGKSVRRIDWAGARLPASTGTRPTNEYVWADRTAHRTAFYWDDVPEEVIAADAAAQVHVPGPLAAFTRSPEGAARAARQLEIPVFLGVGERDTVPGPHEELGCYQACPDLTLFVLPTSAHCHNFASTRRQLWERIVRWIHASERERSADPVA
jgi:pimeloyl-ACP methyl ester carboxylesterase